MVLGENVGKEEVWELRTLLLLGTSRLFNRMDDLKDTMEDGFKRMEDGFKGMERTIRNSMYPIWISIVAGIVTYIIINKPFF